MASWIPIPNNDFPEDQNIFELLSTFPLSLEAEHALNQLSLDQLVSLRRLFEGSSRLTVPVCNNVVSYLIGSGWSKLQEAWNVWGTLRRWIHPSKSKLFRFSLWLWYASPTLHGAIDIEGTLSNPEN